MLYRDLKASNIIINKLGQIRIIDFGLSRRMEKKKKRRSFSGTLHAMAPEFFLDKSYSYEVDIFALGILAYELTHLRPPFGYKAKKEDYKKIYKNE